MARFTSIYIEAPVDARVFTGRLGDGKHYFSLYLNDSDVSLLLPGDDAGAIATARVIAGVLTDAADELEEKLRLKHRSSVGDLAAEQDEADSRD